MVNIKARLKARLKAAYPFLLASLMLFFLAVILDVFTWAWEGRAADIAQTALISSLPPSIIFRYVITIFLTLVGVAVIFWSLSKFSPKIWTKIAGVLGIDHLFKPQSTAKQMENESP